MTGDQKNIDKLFRDHLNGVRIKAPVHAWNRLDSALNVSSFRKSLIYIRLAAASVLILIAFGAGYYYSLYVNQSPSIVEKETPVTAPEENAGSNPELSSQALGLPDTTPNEVENPEFTSTSSTADLSPSEKLTSRQDIEVVLNAEPEKNLILTESQNSSSDELVQTNVSQLAFLDIGRIEPGESSLAIQNTTKTNYSSLELYPDYGNFVPYELEDYKGGKKKQLALGAQFAPVKSYREISPNYGSNAASGNQDPEADYNNTEEALNSYAGGLNIDYNFSGNWSFQSGMYFSRIGQVNSDGLQFDAKNNELILSSISTSTGNINVIIDRVPENVRKITSPKDTIDMSGVENVRIVQNFDLLEIPFLLRYKILNRKLSMSFSGGLSPAYLLDNSTYLELEDRKYDVGNSGNLNSMIFNTSLGLGIEYLFTDKLSISLEPTFKYSLNPINNNSDFSYHPYSFSWFTGIRLKIN